MKILGIESSAPSASAAVVEDGKVICEFFANTGLTHSVTLVHLISDALEFAGITVGELDGISVAAGPGSFTGVRIGVAAAKGLAQKDNIPCIPVSTLSGIAYPLKDSDCVAVAVMDARCKQVYTASFDCRFGEFNRLTDDRAIAIDELKEYIDSLDKTAVLIGDGADLVYGMLKDKCENLKICSAQYRFQHASSVALFGCEEYNKTKNRVTADELVPVYLRPSQAEQLKNRNKKGE